MQKAIVASNNNFPQALFDQYPWAANHNDAITCITRYMDSNTESIIQRLDKRILNKVAKDNWILSNTTSFT